MEGEKMIPWDFVSYFLILSFIIMIVLKALLYSLKINEKKISPIYLVFSGIGFFIFMNLIAVAFGQDNMYNGLSSGWYNFYLFSTIFSSIVLILTYYLYQKKILYAYISGLIGCVFLSPVLFEILEDPILSYKTGWAANIEWGEALPEVIFFTAVICFMFLNFINIILACYQKYKEKAKPEK
jgi:hypothetical protein